MVLQIVPRNCTLKQILFVLLLIKIADQIQVDKSHLQLIFSDVVQSDYNTFLSFSNKKKTIVFTAVDPSTVDPTTVWTAVKPTTVLTIENMTTVLTVINPTIVLHRLISELG